MHRRTGGRKHLLFLKQLFEGENMRQAIVNAVNRLAEESGSLDFELMEAYKLISDYQKESKKAIFKMVIELKNGLLCIDGKPKGRIVPILKPFIREMHEADYYENKIYERQENYSL